MPHMSTRRAALSAAFALSLVALPAAPALADPAPPPGCQGIAFTDPAGDQKGAAPNSGNPLAGDNEDLLAGWVRTDGEGATAFIRVKDLSPALPPTAQRLHYEFEYLVDDTAAYVVAVSDGTSWFYYQGTIDKTTGAKSQGTAVQGRAFPGPDGVLAITLPEAYPDAKISGMRALVREFRGVFVDDGLYYGLIPTVDTTTVSNKTFTVGKCADAPVLYEPDA
jgi:hypothetical protein